MSVRNGNSGPPRAQAEDELFVVHVCDARASALAGHAGGEYVSPPQQREQAVELVGLLLGRPAALDDQREQHWRLPIAGGQRSVTLRRAG